MKAFIIGLIAIVLVGGGYFVIQSNKKTSSTKSSQPATSQSSVSPKASSNSSKAAATITYDGSGFSPGSVTVKSGDTVEIKNTSAIDVQFDSNPHPAHTDDTDLNVNLIAAGQTATFTVTKTGTFGYHNHLNPDEAGSITVQ